jgi:hypothetical protein
MCTMVEFKHHARFGSKISWSCSLSATRPVTGTIMNATSGGAEPMVYSELCDLGTGAADRGTHGHNGGRH